MVRVLAGPAAIIAVDGSAEPRLFAELRDVTVARDPLSAFLAAIGPHVRTVPSFAFVAVDGEAVRVLMRGAIQLQLAIDGVLQAVAAAEGVSTWAETVFPNATDAVISTGAADFHIALVASAAPPTTPVASVASQTPHRPSQDTLVPAELEDATSADEDPNAAPPAPEPAPAPAPAPALEPERDLDFGNLFETKGPGVAATPLVEPAINGIISQVPGVATAQRGGSQATDQSDQSDQSDQRDQSDQLGEHDGLTMIGDALAAVRRSSQASAAVVPKATPATAITVPAVLCPSRHANPPAAPSCLTCGLAIADRAIVSVPRPTVGRLVFDGGRIVPIDRRTLIGRQPSAAAGAPVDDLPALVPVPDPGSLLSRNHAEIRVEGWELTITDLGSRNGTFVVPPGQGDMFRLRAREPYPVAAGMLVHLADVTTCTYQPGGGS